MKKATTNLSSIFFTFVILMALALVSCKEQINKYDINPGPTQTGAGNITGKVLNSSGSPLVGAKVNVGSINTFTDSKGRFFLEKVPTGEKILVNFSYTDYATTQKIVQVVSNRTSEAYASLIAFGKKQTIGIAGGTVTFNGAKVDFPANSFVDKAGLPFTGNAQVNATWFDPTSAYFYGCFPGEFKGVRTDGSESQIESFGFINVEIVNGKDKLQMATGKSATVTMPIPAKILSKAPPTIPLWYYDEQKGSWVEEGFATKTNSNYVGTVKHFSSWNCDQPTKTSYLKGRVVDKDGNPLSFITVHSEGIDYTGSSTTRTGDDGRFKVAVKSASNAKVWASYHTFQSASQNITTPATGDSVDIGDFTITIDSTNICFVVGRVIDNLDNPIQYFNVMLSDSVGKTIDYVSTSADGKYQFFTELNKKYTVLFSVWYSDSTDASRKFYITTPNNSGIYDMGDIKLNIGGSTLIGRAVDSLNNPIPNLYISGGDQNSSGREGSRTDSLGNFSISVRPNITFKLYFYNKGSSHNITVTSGALGETKNLGDLIIK